MSLTRKIKKNKKKQTLSAYTKKAHENGYKNGVSYAIKHLQNNIDVLKDIEGLDEELFDKIVHKLSEEGLI